MKPTVFVKIDRYREIVSVINELTTKLEEAKRTLRKIKELKGVEDQELGQWQNELTSVEYKLSMINEALSKQQKQ